MRSNEVLFLSLQVAIMLPFRQTVAILVVVAVFTSVAAGPRPEEAKKETDNVIPQVRCDSLTARYRLAERRSLCSSQLHEMHEVNLFLLQVNISNKWKFYTWDGTLCACFRLSKTFVFRMNVRSALSHTGCLAQW